MIVQKNQYEKWYLCSALQCSFLGNNYGFGFWLNAFHEFPMIDPWQHLVFESYYQSLENFSWFHILTSKKLNNNELRKWWVWLFQRHIYNTDIWNLKAWLVTLPISDILTEHSSKWLCAPFGIRHSKAIVPSIFDLSLWKQAIFFKTIAQVYISDNFQGLKVTNFIYNHNRNSRNRHINIQRISICLLVLCKYKNRNKKGELLPKELRFLDKRNK